MDTATQGAVGGKGCGRAREARGDGKGWESGGGDSQASRIKEGPPSRNTVAIVMGYKIVGTLEPNFKETKVGAKLVKGGIQGSPFRERATRGEGEETRKGSNNWLQVILVAGRKVEAVTAGGDLRGRATVSSGRDRTTLNRVGGSRMLGET